MRLFLACSSEHLTIAMRADSLARTVDTERSDTIVYVRATADGLTPVTRLLPPTLYDPPSAIDPVGRLIEPHERMRRARELAAGLEPARLSNPTYRANVIGALRMLGADPTVVARFGPP